MVPVPTFHPAFSPWRRFSVEKETETDVFRRFILTYVERVVKRGWKVFMTDLTAECRQKGKTLGSITICCLVIVKLFVADFDIAVQTEKHQNAEAGL